MKENIKMCNWKINYEYKKKYLKYQEIKIYSSCDICRKQSSFNNRTCNNCFGKLLRKDSKNDK